MTKWLPGKKGMTWRRWLIFLATAIAPCPAHANTGIFEGSGHTIKLVHSADVEMQSEEVTIVPGRGPFLFNGSTMDRVNYECKFVLHNRSKKPVTIQVGFPLNSQFMSASSDPKKYDPTELVFKYKFIVRDKERTYHVRFVPQDEDHKLSSIFLWNMTFQGDETRTLNVAYEIPMTAVLYCTEKESDIKYAKTWYERLTPCIYEGIEYVTVTGQSWAGPIGTAKFNVHVGGFEQYLATRYIIERPEFTAKEQLDLEKSQKERATRLRQEIKEARKDKPPLSDTELDALIDDLLHYPVDFHIKNCLIHRKVSLKEWQEKDGVIRWEFKNYRPQESLDIAYVLVILPKTPEGVPMFIKWVLGEKPKQEDLNDLREIYLAWWGIAPQSKTVREFVSNQHWYSPKDGMTMEKLTAEQKVVISAIEQQFPPKKTTVP